jgi:hypothetical protein
MHISLFFLLSRQAVEQVRFHRQPAEETGRAARNRLTMAWSCAVYDRGRESFIFHGAQFIWFALAELAYSNAPADARRSLACRLL